ncbi:MAG TPA: response regulator [Thermoanaerobaculia bacterium]|nr:response regulator [Thermoanaerobaculia bacterium]
MTRAVLIIDDDPPLRALLQKLLAHAGEHDVVTASDGDEAIVLLGTRTFDVILLDLKMPRRDGYAVIDYLKTHRPEQLRVVLVMTATDEYEGRLDPHVVHGVISKPFDNDTVVALIREIFDAAA